MYYYRFRIELQIKRFTTVSVRIEIEQFWFLDDPAGITFVTPSRLSHVNLCKVWRPTKQWSAYLKYMRSKAKQEKGENNREIMNFKQKKKIILITYNCILRYESCDYNFHGITKRPTPSCSIDNACLFSDTFVAGCMESARWNIPTPIIIIFYLYSSRHSSSEIVNEKRGRKRDPARFLSQKTCNS